MLPAPRTVARLIACCLLAAALLAPASASASKTQLSLIQDDRELLSFSGQDAGASMAEIRALGADVIRTNVIFYKIFKSPRQRRRPSGFNAADPNSPHYDWSRTDRLVDLARENGMQILMTVTGPGPYFTSSAPSRCRGVDNCTYKPKPAEFGKFVAAAAKRYSGKVAWYSVYNEPNLVDWLTPQQARPGGNRTQTEGAMYRKLWIAAYKSIARYDRARRNRVLFGETAAIGEPLSLFRSALCLDERARPFRGRQARAHGCGGRPARLNIGGFAIHPYNFGGYGTPRTATRRKTALPIAHIPRLHRVISAARRYRRLSRRPPIFVTEFGFQSNPPDRISRVSLAEQAQYINESDRLLYGDPRVAMVAQYELTDPPEQDQFNSGLRFAEQDGRGTKASYEAYRLPIVVTRRSASRVEVYGQVRPARLLGAGPFTSVSVQMAQGGGEFQTVATPSTNRRGIFAVNVSRSGASSARWRLSWQNVESGQFFTSRTARAGAPLRFRRN